MKYQGPERRGKDRRWQIPRELAERWQDAGVDRRKPSRGRRADDVLPPSH
ncbi:hypothetical protein [Ferrimonas senticii]|nr:hypothetical protein [Ferrimonas senticii]